MIHTNANIRTIWHNVPYLDYNHGYSANLLRSRYEHEKKVDKAYMTAMHSNPPYILKLSVRRFPLEVTTSSFVYWGILNMRAYYAIQIARTKIHSHHLLIFNHSSSSSIVGRNNNINKNPQETSTILKRININGCEDFDMHTILTIGKTTHRNSSQKTPWNLLIIDTCDFCYGIMGALDKYGGKVGALDKNGGKVGVLDRYGGKVICRPGLATP